MFDGAAGCETTTAIGALCKSIASLMITWYVPAVRSVGIGPNVRPPSNEYSKGSTPHSIAPRVKEPLFPPLHVTLTGVRTAFVFATLTVTRVLV